jgi:hypothetical protein
MVDDDNDVHDMQRPRNEIDEFIDTRYVSALECVYRILSFSMHDHKRSVVRLAVHEQDTYTVTYDPLEETYEDILSREDTSLSAFFEVCAKYPDLTANLLYPDAPSKFVLKTTDAKKVWEIRQKGDAVGRVYFGTPSTRERYYVRMLLYHVPGLTSFDDFHIYQRFDQLDYTKEDCWFPNIHIPPSKSRVGLSRGSGVQEARTILSIEGLSTFGG